MKRLEVKGCCLGEEKDKIMSRDQFYVVNYPGYLALLP